jgi:hypothetical protein
MNSNTTRALLGILVLCCAPALASVPEEGLQISGAERVGENAYLATEGTFVTLAFRAHPGDAIWVFAAALDDSGQPDYSDILTLMADRGSKTGMLSGAFQVPKGLAGRKFQIVGLALNADGDILVDEALMKIVAPQPVNDVADGG